MKKNLNIIKFAAMCLSAFGGIGSIGYLLYYRQWAIAAGVVCLAIAAVPQIAGRYKEIM